MISLDELTERALNATRVGPHKTHMVRWIGIVDVLIRAGWRYTDIYTWLKDQGEPVPDRLNTFLSTVGRSYRKWIQKSATNAIEKQDRQRDRKVVHLTAKATSAAVAGNTPSATSKEDHRKQRKLALLDRSEITEFNPCGLSPRIIASDSDLWIHYFDPTASEEDFEMDTESIDERLSLMMRCGYLEFLFGKDACR